MLTLSTWKTPATAYPEAKLGKAEIKTLRYRGIHRAYGFQGHQFYRARNLPIRSLAIEDETWMVDDPPHWWAMEDHARFYREHVLVAGLGLGLIVHTLHQNSKVTRITVVEKERDVIDLLFPHLPHEKLVVEHGDFWDWDEPADGVFFDLLVGDGHARRFEALRAYVHLVQKFPRPIRIHGFDNEYFDSLGRNICNEELLRS